MKLLRSPLLLFAASVLPLLAAEGDLWTTDLEAAKKTAVEQKKDLLLSFTGSDWCPGCIMLAERVFSKEEFGAGVKDQFVLVELDFPRDQSKVNAESMKNNELLLDQYFVEEFPSLILADEKGRPYARTALSIHEPKDAEDYVQHLIDLRQRRALRDDALDSASKLQGVEKAKALLDAIADFSDMTVDAFYPHIVAAILEADVEDKTGFREARDYRQAVIGYEASVENLFSEGKFAEVIGLAEEFVKDHDPTGFDRQHILMAKLMAMVEIGQKEEAHVLLAEIKAIAPESEIGVELDRLKGRMEAYFAEGKAAPGPEEGSAPAPEGVDPGSEGNETPPG